MLFSEKQLSLIDPLLLRLSHPKLSQDQNVYAYLRSVFKLKYSESEPIIKFLKELNFLDQSKHQPFSKVRNYFITNYGRKQLITFQDFKSFLKVKHPNLFNKYYFE
jgi:hypothetical protein